MNQNKQANKLVTAAPAAVNKKDYKKWVDLYTKLLADAKIADKFRKKLARHNKGLDKEKQITQVKAVSEALVLWMEKNPI